MQTLIYTYAKDSGIHEWAVAALSTPYVICKFDLRLNVFAMSFFTADALILNEMFKLRQRYVRKEKFRISIGTWNINGDKNPVLEHEYPSILNAWILDGPENLSSDGRNAQSISTMGSFSDRFDASVRRRTLSLQATSIRIIRNRFPTFWSSVFRRSAI